MNKPGYKHSAVGWVPEEWELVRLDKVIELINGRAFKPSEWEKKGLPIIRIQNLNDQDAEFNYYGGQVDEKHYVAPGDLLFAWSGTKGVSFGVRKWENGMAVLNQHIFKISLKKESLIYEYTLPVLLFVQSMIEEKAHGFKSSFVHVKKGDLDKTILPLPSVPEQQRISTILSTWDKAIANEQQLIKTLEVRHRALMQQLLSGKKRLKGFKGEWRDVILGEDFDFVRSYSIPRDGLKYSDDDFSIYCIHYGDIHTSYERGILDFEVEVDIPQLLGGVSVNEDDFLKDGDIIIADASEDYDGVGESIELRNVGRRKVIGGLHTIVLRDKTAVTQKGFRAYMFTGEIVRNKLKKLATGTSVYSVSKSTIEKIIIKVPSLEEQNSISAILNSSDNEIKIHYRRLKALQQQKKGLMQVLLTGKVRVKI